MSKCLHHPHRRRATSAVYVVVTLPVLLGCAALTIDVGHLYNVRIELQNTVDAAALSAASALPLGKEEVFSRARAIAAMNMANGQPVEVPDADIVLGRWDSDTASFIPLADDDDSRPDAVRVITSRTGGYGNSVGLYFAQIFGLISSDVSASATATFGTGDTWDVIIVQDISGSFTPALPSARDADEALVSCLKDHTDNDSRIGMVSYTGSSQLVFPLEAIETGFDDLIDAIVNLDPCCKSWWSNCGTMPDCSTGTNIAAGIDEAVNEFLNAPLPDPDIGQAIVIVSDGRPQSVSGPLTDEELRDLAVQASDNAWANGISIFAIYYAGSSSTPQQDADFLASLIRGDGIFEATPEENELSGTVWKVCASLPHMLVE